MDDALAEIADEIGALPGEGRVLIGVTGPPGAGKSTVATALVARLKCAAYLPMDGFHLSNAQLARLGRRDRKGAADTFDAYGYAATLARVADAYGRSDVYVPDFDRAIDDPVAAGLVVPADVRVVVTEGNYLGLWPPVRALLDRLYYVHRPAEARRPGLIARHMAGGRTRAGGEAWVDDVDEPNARVVEATREQCDRTFVLGDTGELRRE